MEDNTTNIETENSAEVEPATPQVAGPTQMAAILEDVYGVPVSRQQVDRWRQRSEANDFPAMVYGLRRANGNVVDGYDVSAVIRWYQTYQPSMGGRPPKDAAA